MKEDYIAQHLRLIREELKARNERLEAYEKAKSNEQNVS